MRCKCANKVLQKSGDRVRMRIHGPLVIDGDRCLAKCFWCKRDVELPLQLKPDVQIPGETFLVRR